MRKIVIVYGLISGVIVSLLLWLWMFLFQKEVVNFDNGEMFGYASMLVALSMVFFGIKSYRDNQNNRSIRFWKGVQVGLFITLLASFVYAAGWEVYYQLSPDVRDSFIDRYTEHYIAKLKEKGATQDEIERTAAEMASFREMYKNPAIRFGMTIIEILPVGIVVTLLSAAILRKKEILTE